jgi:hypothetical protein
MTLSLVKRLLGPRSEAPEPVSELHTKRSMARQVFRDEDRYLAIRKTYLVEVQDTSFLVPKEAREDDTGYTHLTNEVEAGRTYDVGLRLAPYPKGFPSASWRMENTTRFKGYVNSRNHITIPQTVREANDIEDGDVIQVAIAGIVFEPTREQRSYLPEYMRP